MATILCLETATTNCSVALAIDGKVVAEREENNKKFSHAEKLHVFIEEVLNQCNTAMAQLHAVAVGRGPGSYTGLRIGVSAAKGLCFALDIPLISIDTLKLLAREAQCQAPYIVPLLDARRMEVYSAVFNSKVEQIRSIKAEILNQNSFHEYLEQGKTVFLGDGSVKFEAICNHENAVFQTGVFPSAREMASLAEAKYKISDTEDVAYFEPYYLKEFLPG